jgi:Ribonucleotide reductase inhibitor
MRVRKSVPEGYKTGSPRKNGVVYGGGGAGWGFLDSGPASSPTSFKTRGGGGPGGGSAARRELTPFCGIMKVGGMAVQGWDYGLEQEDREVPGEDDLPFLHSQGSTISTLSMDFRPGNKRRFDEEENEEPEGVTYDIWRDADDDVQLSPKSRPVDLTPGLGRRAMAVPKSRRKGSGRDGRFKIAVMEGQENDNLGVLEVDFGDAEFMDWSSCLG